MMGASEPDPGLRQELWRLFVKHNPLYLLSAGCMLAGCYALSAALAPEPGRLGGLLALLGVLNAYEALLIALGLFLVTRRALPRDGRTLLLLETAFLFDATHLCSEAASDGRWGLLVACVALLLGGAKIHVVGRALHVELPLAQLILVATGLGAVLMLPGGLAILVRGGRPVEDLLYSSWWAVGLLVVLQSLATPAAGAFARPEPAEVSPRRAFGRALVVLPSVSLVLHLFALSWLYDAPFHLCHLGPLGLALSLCAVRTHPEWFLRTRLALPTICVVATLLGCWDDPPHAVLSPLGATALLAGLIHLYDFRRNRTFAAAWLAALYLVVGPAVRFWDSWVGFLMMILPSTLAEWGRWGIAAAFVQLGLGLLLSLRKARRGGSEAPAEG
jgi:hypothetical protein